MGKLKLLLNAPRIFVVFNLLILFFLLESVMMIIYIIIESPLAFILRQLEKGIRWGMKNVK